MRENITVDFSNPYIPKIEDVDFKNSLFSDTYKKAYKSLKMICADNDSLKDGEPDHIYNLIPFTGDRGSGKSSAMFSFVKYLKDSNSAPKNLDDKYILDRSFVVLDSIDAGHLEEGEDLLSIVMARMMAYYNDQDKAYNRHNDADYKKTRLYQKFSNIYTHLSNLNDLKENSISSGKSALKILSDLDASQNLRNSFKNLTQQFLDALHELNDEKKAYVVISIDDIDMNVRNAHRMLEEIQTYMMIPYVIITFTASYDNLRFICQNYYTKDFESRITASSYLMDAIGKSYGKEIIANVDTLASEYLGKLLPTGRMLHLGETNEYDFYLKTENRNDISELLTDYSSLLKYGKFIALKLAQCTGIFLYHSESRDCFIVPKSLRAKAQLFEKIRKMEIVFKYDEKYKSYKTVESYEQLLSNLRLIQDEIILRYMYTLSEQEQQFLKSIVYLDIDEFPKEISNAFNKLYRDINSNYSDRRSQINLVPLSGSRLCDIMSFLYNNSNSEITDYNFKKIVEVILALYSIKLKFEEYNLIKSDLERTCRGEKGEAENRLKTNNYKNIILEKYIGSSIFSELDMIMCKEVSLINVNAGKENDSPSFPLIIRRIGYNKTLTLNIENFIQKNGIIDENGCLDIDVIHAYAMLLMFLSIPKCEVSVNELINTEKSVISLYLSLLFENNVEFSFSSYFVNILNTELITNFYYAIIENAEKWNSNIATSSSGKLIDTNSIEKLKVVVNTYKAEFKKNLKSKLPPLPVFDAELIYNMALNTRHSVNLSTKYYTPWDACCMYFKNLGDELKNTENEYGKLIIDKKTDNKPITFAEKGYYATYSLITPQSGNMDKKMSFVSLNSREQSEFNKIISTLRWGDGN